MAAGKSSKRVKLRAKTARRQHTQQAAGECAMPSNNLSSSSPSTGSSGEAAAALLAAPTTTEADRQVALHIRDALQQRRGRTGRASAARVSGASGVRATQGMDGAKRQSVKSAKKDMPSSQRTAALRRVKMLERRRQMLPKMSAAEERMAAAQEELKLFDKVQTVPAYAADPFAAVMQHLSATMEVLQPLTPNVGRAERATDAGRRC
ncbi:hypothetical protein JIQ42_08177 [Leishmania sp. Namibia]|uniref:hypothetical protein n=1 Tax=Leishmania sp. Namibia TaxID=2802991 RepID=UPI001B452BD1|nr:hypothetical protein JIQ42_08177 [Leishmania sp. Namibia]